MQNFPFFSTKNERKKKRKRNSISVHAIGRSQGLYYSHLLGFTSMINVILMAHLEVILVETLLVFCAFIRNALKEIT